MHIHHDHVGGHHHHDHDHECHCHDHDHDHECHCHDHDHDHECGGHCHDHGHDHQCHCHDHSPMEELAALLGKPALTLEEMLAEGRRLLESGIEEIVISLGGDGALFVSADGCFRAEGLQVPVKSTVGAGDSMVAAMAYGQAENLSREQMLRLAVAMGAASVMQSGSQPPESALVWELAKQVSLKKL